MSRIDSMAVEIGDGTSSFLVQELSPAKEGSFSEKELSPTKKGDVVEKDVAFCTVVPSLNDELRRLLRSIQMFMPRAVLYITTTAEEGETMSAAFPELNIRVPQKMSNIFKTYANRNRTEMQAEYVREDGLSTWTAMNLVKADTMRFVLEDEGYKGVWYMDSILFCSKPCLPFRRTSLSRSVPIGYPRLRRRVSVHSTAATCSPGPSPSWTNGESSRRRADPPAAETRRHGRMWRAPSLGIRTSAAE